MHFLKHLASCAVLGMIASLGAMPRSLAAAEEPAASKQSNGTFVSFQDGKLTIKGLTGLVEFKQVGKGFKTYQNNEAGPGSKLVDTVETLSRAVPGTVVQVDAEQGEVYLGLDYRVIGTFESFDDGKLHLRAADVPPGFIQRPAGQVVLTIEPSTPVLESIDGGDFKYAGEAGKVLKSVKPGATITARSEYDPNIIEVVQIGQPKRQIERYIGQTRGAVRGTFMSFQGGVLRMRGKGLTTLAANEYERAVNIHIPAGVPIVESIDGSEYRPTTVETLQTLKEGAVVTIRKVEEVVLEVQIGVAKQ